MSRGLLYQFFRAAGRVIAMSLVSGTPLGVVMPEAVWSVLLVSGSLNAAVCTLCVGDFAFLKSEIVEIPDINIYFFHSWGIRHAAWLLTPVG